MDIEFLDEEGVTETDIRVKDLRKVDPKDLDSETTLDKFKGYDAGDIVIHENRQGIKKVARVIERSKRPGSTSCMISYDLDLEKGNTKKTFDINVANLERYEYCTLNEGDVVEYNAMSTTRTGTIVKIQLEPDLTGKRLFIWAVKMICISVRWLRNSGQEVILQEDKYI